MENKIKLFIGGLTVEDQQQVTIMTNDFMAALGRACDYVVQSIHPMVVGETFTIAVHYTQPASTDYTAELQDEGMPIEETKSLSDYPPLEGEGFNKLLDGKHAGQLVSSRLDEEKEIGSYIPTPNISKLWGTGLDG